MSVIQRYGDRGRPGRGRYWQSRVFYRLALHPDGLAPRVHNLAEWARHILTRLGHLPELRAELTGYVSELGSSAGQLGFAVPLQLATSFGELHLMTAVTTFATAVDVTLAELKLEAFLPVDPATAEALSRAVHPRTSDTTKCSCSSRAN